MNNDQWNDNNRPYYKGGDWWSGPFFIIFMIVFVILVGVNL